MTDEEITTCFVCLDDDGDECLLRACACTTCVHASCLARLVNKVPAYRDGACGICRMRLPVSYRVRGYEPCREAALPYAAYRRTLLASSLPFGAFALVCVASQPSREVPRTIVIVAFALAANAVLGFVLVTACNVWRGYVLWTRVVFEWVVRAPPAV